MLTDESRRDQFPDRVHRRHFEACVFSQLMLELKAGDLCIIGSDAFADYREQLVSWETYHDQVAEYGTTAGVPVDGPTFVGHVRDWLAAIAQTTDDALPTNKLVRIENGEPIITRPPRKTESSSVRDLEARLAEHMPDAHILDMLADTEHWLHWTSPFGPISGHETKLEDPAARYLATVFCYGANMGPSQAARSLDGLDRRQIAWINLHHVTEDGLDDATTLVVNGYNRFLMIRAWGSGKHVSADGTKWDLYERNLLSEYHIRGYRLRPFDSPFVGRQRRTDTNADPALKKRTTALTIRSKTVVGQKCSSRFSVPSIAFASYLQARLPLGLAPRGFY